MSNSKKTKQMKKSKFTENQIVQALKEHEAGKNVDDICRQLGINREVVLDSMISSNLNQVREQTSKWMEDYNEKHPHSSLSDLSPRGFLNSKAKKKMSTLAL